MGDYPEIETNPSPDGHFISSLLQIGVAEFGNGSNMPSGCQGTESVFVTQIGTSSPDTTCGPGATQQGWGLFTVAAQGNYATAYMYGGSSIGWVQIGSAAFLANSSTYGMVAQENQTYAGSGDSLTQPFSVASNALTQNGVYNYWTIQYATYVNRGALGSLVRRWCGCRTTRSGTQRTRNVDSDRRSKVSCSLTPLLFMRQADGGCPGSRRNAGGGPPP